MKRVALGLSAVLAFTTFTACSDSGEGSGCDPACEDGQACQDGTCVDADALDGGRGDADLVISGKKDAGTTQTKVDAGTQACAAESTKAQKLPLDIYLMLDKSGSMAQDKVANGDTKWEAVTSALNTFFSSSTAGTAVGLQYFPLQAAGATCDSTILVACDTSAECGSCGPCEYDYDYGYICSQGWKETTCTASAYATPAVEISAMPAAASALSSNIAAQYPIGGTPTSAALQGAIDHARTWASAHTDHVTIALLATDGEPTECDTNLTNINNIAKGGVSGSPKILTFVIGVGSSLSALNGIAAAGGTTSATLVDTGGDVNAQLLAAMNAIRGAALGCTYEIPVPSSGTPDYTKVNVQYTPGGTTTAQILPQVASKSACPTSGDAWYYNSATAPTQILLCDSTCNKVKADTSGSVDVLLGCQTIIN